MRSLFNISIILMLVTTSSCKPGATSDTSATRQNNNPTIPHLELEELKQYATRLQGIKPDEMSQQLLAELSARANQLLGMLKTFLGTARDSEAPTYQREQVEATKDTLSRIASSIAREIRRYSPSDVDDIADLLSQHGLDLQSSLDRWELAQEISCYLEAPNETGDAGSSMRVTLVGSGKINRVTIARESDDIPLRLYETQELANTNVELPWDATSFMVNGSVSGPQGSASCEKTININSPQFSCEGIPRNINGGGPICGRYVYSAGLTYAAYYVYRVLSDGSKQEVEVVRGAGTSEAQAKESCWEKHKNDNRCASPR